MKVIVEKHKEPGDLEVAVCHNHMADLYLTFGKYQQVKTVL